MLERGENWMITDPVNIQLFDATGVRGDRWRLNGEEIRPRKWSVELIKLVRSVIGRIYGREQIQIKVSPEIGVMLYLEEVLTLDHLRRAHETSNAIFCTNVEIGGVRRQLIIERGMKPWEPAVLDDQGTAFS